jgi:O-antigen/teichoic acid export membrane protein
MGVAGTIAKNTVFNFIATASDLGITLLIGIVLARSLGTEQYGLYSYLIWFLGLIAVIVNLGLGEMATRFTAEALGNQRIHEPQGLARMTLMLRGGAALFVCFAVIISSGYWARFTGDSANKIYFVIIAFSSVLQALNLAMVSIFRGFQKYEYTAYVQLGTGPLRFVLIIVFMVLGFNILEVLTINIAVSAVGSLIGLLLLRRLMPLKNLLLGSLPDTAIRKRALKYAMTMVGIIIVDYLAYRQAEVFLIGLYCPVEEVGFYRLAFNLVDMSMMLIPAAFAAVLLPAIAEQFGKGDMEKLRMISITSARCLMMVALPMAAGMIALASPIITLLYGADYTPAIILLQILVVPMAIFNIAGPASAVIFGINRPGFSLKINVGMALLNISLNVWLISHYGILGAAMGKSVPLILGAVLYIAFASRKIGTAWPVRDTIKIATASLFMGMVVYTLQSRLDAVPSLALCIPLGIIIYIIAIFFLRVIGKQDIDILKRIQGSLPTTLRKSYSVMLNLVETLVLR